MDAPASPGVRLQTWCTQADRVLLLRGLCNLHVVQVETDEFQYNFTAAEKPHVQNDTVTLHRRFANVRTMPAAGTG